MVKGKSRPVKKRSSRVEKKSSPAKEKSSLVEEKSSPAKERSSLVEKKSSPVKERSSLVEEKSSPVKKKTSLIEKNCPECKDPEGPLLSILDIFYLCYKDSEPTASAKTDKPGNPQKPKKKLKVDDGFGDAKGSKKKAKAMTEEVRVYPKDEMK